MLLIALTVAACGATNRAEPPSGAEGTPPPPDTALAAEGKVLYDGHCASCHGIDGAGADDWKTPNADGSYPPPPQDSTGHTWHHSDRVLVELIADGSDYPGSRMPAFGDRLSTDQIQAVLEYIKTWWGPDERAFQWEVSQRDG